MTNDKRKFKYNPNERKSMRPSGLQRQANEATRGFFKGSSNVAENYAAGALGRQIGRTFKAAGSKLAEDFGDTRKAVAATRPPEIQDPQKRMFSAMPQEQSAINTNTALKKASMIDPQPPTLPATPGLQRPQPNDAGRRFFADTNAASVPSVAEENIQQQTSPGLRRPQPDEENLQVQQSNNGRTFSLPGGTMSITGPPPKSASTNRRSFRSDGKYTMNNGLQVEFDPSTSQDQRRAFMRQPTRPARNRQPKTLAPGEMSAREKYFARSQGKAGDITEGMGRKEAMDYRKIQAIREGNRLSAETDLATTRMTEQGSIGRQRSENDIAHMNAQTAAELTGAQVGKYESEAQRQQAENQIINQLRTAKDPAERARLQEDLLTVQGKFRPRDYQLSEKEKIKLQSDLRKEYEEATEGISGHLDRSVVDYDTWLKFYRPEARQALYDGSPENNSSTPQTVEDVIRSRQDYLERYNQASGEERKTMNEAIKKRLEEGV